MAVALILTSLTTFSLWAVSQSQAVKDRVARYEADRLQRWIISKMVEARCMGKMFSIRMTDSPSPILILVWGDTGEKEYFDAQKKLFARKYSLKTNSVLSDSNSYSSPSARYCGYNPKWHMFHPGFTLKLTTGTSPKEKALKFLVVSPAARVRLCDTAPKD